MFSFVKERQRRKLIGELEEYLNSLSKGEDTPDKLLSLIQNTLERYIKTYDESLNNLKGLDLIRVILAKEAIEKIKIYKDYQTRVNGDYSEAQPIIEKYALIIIKYVDTLVHSYNLKARKSISLS